MKRNLFKTALVWLLALQLAFTESVSTLAVEMNSTQNSTVINIAWPGDGQDASPNIHNEQFA